MSSWRLPPARCAKSPSGSRRIENVSYVAGSIGNGDLSIQVCLRDTQELLHFVDEVVGTMPGVTRTRTVLVPWKLKDVYQWSIPPSFDDEQVQENKQV